MAVGANFWQLVYADTWMFQLFTAVTTYGMALGAMLALQSADRERERERRESQLLILARDSELAAIKAQMQPHFVLNVLNSILALIDKDPALARTMVTRLSEMMRAVFEQFDVVQVPLRREIELTKAYLDIERIRFGSRLNVVVEIETETHDAVVPAFLLQPIVENAIKHGVNHHPGGSELRIRSRSVEQRLILEVTNSRRPGPLVDLDSSSSNGRGLQLTRRRLAATYGPDHQLMFDVGPSTLTVRLDIPAHAYDDRTIAAAHR
jgi:LytS/YehU family sensor histidine kinase